MQYTDLLRYQPCSVVLILSLSYSLLTQRFYDGRSQQSSKYFPANTHLFLGSSHSPETTPKFAFLTVPIIHLVYPKNLCIRIVSNSLGTLVSLKSNKKCLCKSFFFFWGGGVNEMFYGIVKTVNCKYGPAVFISCREDCVT